MTLVFAIIPVMVLAVAIATVPILVAMRRESAEQAARRRAPLAATSGGTRRAGRTEQPLAA